ncbi:MAG: PAS domain S-box protein [Ectobacillus sp.]
MKICKIGVFIINLLVVIVLFGILFWKQRRERCAQEEKIETGERRYQQLIEMSPNPIIIQMHNKIVYINEAGLRMLGAGCPEQVLGMSMFGLIVPSLWKIAWREFQKQRKNDYVQFFETEIIRFDKTRITVEVLGMDTEYQGEAAVQFIFRDITAQRAAQHELIEAKEKLEAFFKNSADPMYILNMDRTVVQVNTAFEQLLHIKEEEIRGRVITDVMEISEEERHNLIERVRNGEIVKGVETSVRKSDGSTSPISLTLSPIHDADGNIVMISGVMRDITPQKQYEQMLKESELRYRMIAEHSSDYIFLLSSNMIVTYASPAIKRVMGYIPEEIIGGHFYTGIHEEDLPKVCPLVERMLLKRDTITLDYRVQSKTGDWIWIEARMIPVLDVEQNIDYIIVSTNDVRERKVYEAQLKRFAYVDSLTGLANRRAFEERLQAMLEQEQPFALCYLDFDKFKWINDSFSHTGGDRFLTEVGQRLQNAIRGSDMAARLGGDEFVLLIPKAQEEEMKIVAKRIVGAFQEPFVYDGQTIQSTVSIGIALYPRDGSDQETLMRRADEAMYYVKENGRNNYCFYCGAS